MKNFKKHLSVLLSIAMLLSLVHVSAFAEGMTKSTLSAEMKSLGYSEMWLDAQQISEKDGVAEVLESMENLEEGVDYVKDRICFMADSKSEAERIAACYNADLTFYAYGYAGADVDFSDEKKMKSLSSCSDESIPESVEDLVALAAQRDNSLPAIYPSIIYTVESVEEAGDEAVSEVETIAEELSSIAETEQLAETETVIEEESDVPSLAATSAAIQNPFYNKQWFHKFLNSEALWDQGYTGKGTVVAVVDTGVKTDHPDLKDNITDKQFNMIALDEDYKEEYPDPYDATDDHLHGTHCAGIIAASNNEVGGVGVAYDAKILPIKALLANGSGLNEHVAAGIAKATDEGADVISLSLGGHITSPVLSKAVADAVAAGAVVVTSAANDGRRITETLPNNNAIVPGVINVGALGPNIPGISEGDSYYFSELENEYTEDDLISSRKWVPESEKAKNAEEIISTYKKEDGAFLSLYSQYYRYVSILAPGSSVYSTVISTDKYETIGKSRIPTEIGDAYTYVNGTSQACPMVAATAAILCQVSPEIKKQQGGNWSAYVRSLLQLSGDGKKYNGTEYRPKAFMYNAVDPVAAVELLKSGDVKEVETLAAPKFTVTKNADGTLKGGAKSRITIENIDDYPRGTHFYYTIDGTTPSYDNGIDYESDGTLEGISLKSKVQVVADRYRISSPVSVLNGPFYTPIESIKAKNPSLEILPGKSSTLELEFGPEDYNKSDIRYASDNDNIRVDKKGKITVDKTAAPGTKATIKITDAFSTVSTNAAITVVSSDKTQKVVLPENYASGITLFQVQPVDNSPVLLEANLAEDLAKAGSVGTELFTYKSSKPGVAVVENGVLVPKASGKTKITVLATDGSGQSKSFNVNVICPVRYMRIDTDTDFYSGYETKEFEIDGETVKLTEVPLGYKKCKVKLTTVMSSACTNKKVNYTVSCATEGVISVSKSGVLKPGKNAKPGDQAIITATAADGYGASTRIMVKIYEPVEKIVFATKDNDGNVTFSNSLTTELKYENQMNLSNFDKACIGDAVSPDDVSNNIYDPSLYILNREGHSYSNYSQPYTLLKVTSSKNDIFGVYDNRGGRVYGYLKKSTKSKIKVTFTAKDGSGKKVTLYITEKK